ncbi:MAG: DUF3131 domain-containing protein, partial [Candidatus Amesbacteria bacterium]|nr:DUF3131 domain-containing protein [Candidatus Amesbacteria bacterium]
MQHHISSWTNRLSRDIIQKAKTDYQKIILHYKSLDKPLTPSQKWLIENKPLVIETTEDILQTISSQLLSRLPILKSNPNQIRILVALSELVSLSDFHLNNNRISKYFATYQKESTLTIAELWSIPLILKMLLINSLSTSLQNEKVIKQIILSLRKIQNIDWAEYVEDVNAIDSVFRHDPTGIYPLMDFRTRDSYRHVVEEIHFQTLRPQNEIAQWVLNESQKSNSHIGHYLFGAGRAEIDNIFPPKRKLSESFLMFLHSRPIKIHLGLTWGTALSLFVSLQALFNLPIWWNWLLLFPSFSFANLIVHLIIVRLYHPSFLPKMDSSLPIHEKDRTIVLTPTLLMPDNNETDKMLTRLEENFLANRDNNIFFGLALSWPETKINGGKPSVEEASAFVYVKKALSELNKKYPFVNNRFHLFFRDRKWSIDEQSWVEWERKRGKIIDFVHLLRYPNDSSFSFSTASTDFLSTIKYVITVDDDVALPRDTAKQLIATIIHPLNVAVIDKETRMVVGGYGIIQPRISTKMHENTKSIASYIFEGDSGWDSYSNLSSNVYQDVFRESFFMGRGILNVDIFDKLITGRFPENTLLSHDHIEGFYCRTGFASDITLFETSPSSYSAFTRRFHRWMRGDWQRLFWILPWTGNEKGRIEKNPLSLFHRWKFVEDLIQSLNVPASILFVSVLLLFYPDSQLAGLFFILVVLLANPIISLFESIPVHKNLWLNFGHYLYLFNEKFKTFIFRAMFTLILSLHQSLVTLHAITTSLTRIFITKRKRLEWTIFLHTNQNVHNYALIDGISETLPAIIVALGLLVSVNIFLPYNQRVIPILLFSTWLSSPIMAVLINRSSQKVIVFTKNEIRYLRILARKTWRYFDDLVTKKTNYLPPDHFQQTTLSPVSSRTSATNIGMYLTSLVSAFDLGFISKLELLERFSNTLTTLTKLNLLHGHFFNWYDINSLNVLPPSYVSTVDSGNLAFALMLSAKTLLDLPKQASANISLALDDLLLLAKQEAEPVLVDQLGRIQDMIRTGVSMTSVQHEIEGIEVNTNSELGYWIEKFRQLIKSNLRPIDANKFTLQCQKFSLLAESMAMKMDFSFLYDPKRNLFK